MDIIVNVIKNIFGLVQKILVLIALGSSGGSDLHIFAIIHRVRK